MFINLLKNDFNRVHTVIKMWNDKVPTWAIVIYYILMLPFGLLLIIPTLIWQWYILRKIMK